MKIPGIGFADRDKLNLERLCEVIRHRPNVARQKYWFGLLVAKIQRLSKQRTLVVTYHSMLLFFLTFHHWD